MIGRAFRKFAGWYLRSWLFLLWTALCVSAGAAWMYLAIFAALKVQGVL